MYTASFEELKIVLDYIQAVVFNVMIMFERYVSAVSPDMQWFYYLLPCIFKIYTSISAHLRQALVMSGPVGLLSWRGHRRFSKP